MNYISCVVESILPRCQFPPNSYVYSMSSQSKSQESFFFKGRGVNCDSKIHVEMQKFWNTHNNLEEEEK